MWGALCLAEVLGLHPGELLSVLSYSWHQDMSLGRVETPLHHGGDVGRVTVTFFKWFCIVPFPSPLGFVPVVSLGSAQKQQAPVPASSSSTGHLLGPTEELCCFGAGSNFWECGCIPFLSLTVALGNLLGLL